MKKALFLILLFLGAGTADATPGEDRINKEAQMRAMGLWLIPHQQNYFLPLTYNTSPHPTSQNDAEHKEMKFQLSFKIPLMNTIAGYETHLYFGYTQLALWQFFERDRSSPFRDINYEPELFVSFDTRGHLGSFLIPQIDVGMSHQSNGEGPPDSRSWNRLYTRVRFDKKDFSIAVKPWIPLPNDNDDNNDIYEYMGYGEITASYVKRNHVLSVMLRNNMDFDENRGAIQVDYSFPLTRILMGQLQYFSGYGESLIDYNRPNNRFGIGIALSEWR